MLPIFFGKLFFNGLSRGKAGNALSGHQGKIFRYPAYFAGTAVRQGEEDGVFPPGQEISVDEGSVTNGPVFRVVDRLPAGPHSRHRFVPPQENDPDSPRVGCVGFRDVRQVTQQMDPLALLAKKLTLRRVKRFGNVGSSPANLGEEVTMDTVATYIEANEPRYVEELIEYVKIPSVSTKVEATADMERACRFLVERMREAGLENVEVLPTSGHAAVYGDWLHAPGMPTVLIYGHYDVQPAEPMELWDSPAFDPKIREGQLYGRGTVDNKGQHYLHLMAAESFLKSGQRLPVNVKFIIEGEEEIGSPHFSEILNQHKELLRADALVISDSPMLDRGIPSICYGLRGLAYYEVEVTAAGQDLHSGSFGGAVANPLTVLSEIIAKLHDARGRVAIPGFYKDVLTIKKKERAALRKLPFSQKNFLQTTGAVRPSGEAGYTTPERLWARPTLEINGLWGGYTGEGAKTVLPAKAHAKISCRLVPNQDPKKITRLLERHLKKLTPNTVRLEFRVHSLGKPWVASYTHPFFQAAQKALKKGFGRRAVFIREGGSIPLIPDIQDTFNIPVILMGFGLPDENAHAPNERIDLSNFQNGILSVAYFLKELGELGKV